MALKDSYNTEGRIGVPSLNNIGTEKLWKLNDTLEFIVPEWGVVECVYLQAGSGGVVAGNICTIQDGKGTKISTTADAGKPLCVAVVTIAEDSYGWFAVKGTCQIAAAVTTAVGGKVYLGGTAGQTTSVATVGKAILGAVFAEAVTITSGYKLALATIQHPVQEAPNS